jgi:hypothetical protein
MRYMLHISPFITQAVSVKEYKFQGIHSVRLLFPIVCQFISLTSEYSTQHPVLEHPQLMFFQQIERKVLCPQEHKGWSIKQRSIFNLN